MNKVKEFLKSNIPVITWTIEYFACVGLILWFLFGFNVFSAHHWHIFSHATLHGFGGFVFGTLMYSAIPLYIATVLITYRKKAKIITFTIPETIKNIPGKIKNLFSAPITPAVATEKSPTTNDTVVQEPTEPEFPSDMPRELYIPYMRAKQRVPLAGTASTFNKMPTPPQNTIAPEQSNDSFPIPSDFDISDSLPDMTETPNFADTDFPVFKDLDFDTPVAPAPELSNSVTKYCDTHKIEYETYHDFVATERYLIYDHNDGDFWVMDDETWFASKKQRESPIPEMLELAKQNGLIPVLYLESQNIMDLPGTTDKFESMGIRVIKSLDELN